MPATRRFRAACVLLVLSLLSTILTALPAQAGIPQAVPTVLPPYPTDCRSEPPFGAADMICPVGEVDPGKPGSVDVKRGPSFAATAVKARDVGPGTMTPTIPAGDALAAQVAAQALDRLAAHKLVTAGEADPDAAKLLPSTAQAGLLDLPGPLQTYLTQAAAFVKERTGVDLMTLWRALPEGVPLLTYKLCAESATRTVSCSIPRPLVLPVIADVTGDGTPDIMADMLPAVDLQPVLDLSAQAKSLLAEILSIEDELDIIRKILADPLQLPRHAAALLRKLVLDDLLRTKKRLLEDLRTSLQARLGLGMGLLSMRLPTSETKGGALPAQVWAQYDAPAGLDLSLKRMSFGYDGFRRGASLSGLDWGVFTADVPAATRGVADVKGGLYRLDPGASIATVAGIADLEGHELADPTLVSMRQSPVPAHFSGHAVIDTGRKEASLEVTSSEPAKLDALALSNLGHDDQFTQVVVDKLPATVKAELKRPTADGETEVAFTGSATIDAASVHNYAYAGAVLQKAMTGSAAKLPACSSAHVKSTDARSATLAYRASGPLAESLDAQYYDRAAARTIAQAHLTKLPASLDLALDLPGRRTTVATSSAVGSMEALWQREGGAIVTPPGDHATLITDGPAFGLSGRLTGLRSLDTTYGAHPHAVLTMEPGGEAFLGWASIDRAHLARIDISNLPPTVTVDVDPVNRATHYEASTPIESLRAAYTGTQAGPTLDATAQKVPATVDAGFRLGDTPQLKLTASAPFGKLDGFYSPDHVTRVSPSGGRDVHGIVTDVPKQVTIDANVPARHLEWNADAVTPSAFAVFRGPIAGRDWVIAGQVAGVPKQFTADFTDTVYRIKAAEGTSIGSATVAVANHGAPTALAGLHLAGHFSESSGNIDASASVTAVKVAEYVKEGDGFTVNVDAAGDSVAFDVDSTLVDPGTRKDDTRFMGVGTLGPVPANIVFTAGKDKGPFTYTAQGATNLEAAFAFGKIAALNKITNTPKYDNGVSLVQDSCSGGDGCANARPDDAFCKEGGCFALAGIARMDGLPDTFTLDLSQPDQTRVVFENYRPKTRDLDLYLQFDKVLAVPMRLKVGAKGLPAQVPNLVLGPFTMDKPKEPEPDGDCDDTNDPAQGNDLAHLKVKYSSDAATVMDELTLHGSIDIDGFGPLLLAGTIGKVPGTLDLDAWWGKKTKIKLANSAAVDLLDLRASMILNEDWADGLLRFTEVPADVDIVIDAEQSKGLTMPLFSYDGHGSSGLDGFFAIEGRLISKACPGVGDYLEIPKFWVKLENAGADTRFGIGAGGDIQLTSTPAATKVEAHAPIVIPEFTEKSFVTYVPIPDPVNGSLTLYGRAGMKKSIIKDVGLTMTDLNGLKILPGAKPVEDLPDWFGWLFPGVTEADDGKGYGTLGLTMDGFDIQPDLVVGMKIDLGEIGESHKEARLRPLEAINFHRYDGEWLTADAEEIPPDPFPPLACVKLQIRPRHAEAAENRLEFKGADGPQTFTFLDPVFDNGQSAPDVLLNTFAAKMWPFGGDSWRVTTNSGACTAER